MGLNMDHVVTRGDKKMLHAANMGLVAIVVLLAGTRSPWRRMR
jgi:hypothetical protein